MSCKAVVLGALLFISGAVWGETLYSPNGRICVETKGQEQFRILLDSEVLIEWSNIGLVTDANYSIEWRVTDQGVAYRYNIGESVITDEV